MLYGSTRMATVGVKGVYQLLQLDTCYQSTCKSPCLPLYTGTEEQTTQ